VLIVRHVLCTECGACVPVCHADAIRLKQTGIEVEQALCDLCAICVLLCPTGALLIEDKIREKV
jgi:ferredoxin